MYRATVSLILYFFAVGAFAQSQGNTATAESERRKALLKEFVVQDRGEITIIEPSSRDDGSVVIGYASGAVLICHDNQNCKEFGSTPNTPVEQIAVAKNGASEIIWVTYRQGAIYRCAGDLCTKNLWNNAQSE